MRYADVQVSLEQFIKLNWTVTPLSYQNVPFDSTDLDEFVEFGVLFEGSMQRSIERCHRVVGLVLATVHVRPAIGQPRMLELADNLSILFVTAVVQPIPPHTAPTVNMRNPDIFKDFKDTSSWVKAQISCPFYYDLEV